MRDYATVNGSVDRLKLADQMVRQLPERGEWPRRLQQLDTPFGYLDFDIAALTHIIRSHPDDAVITANALASVLGLPVDKALDVIERAELHQILRRDPHVPDPASAPITLTPRGHETHIWAHEYLKTLMLSELERMDSDELQGMSVVLDQLELILQRLMQR